MNREPPTRRRALPSLIKATLDQFSPDRRSHAMQSHGSNHQTSGIPARQPRPSPGSVEDELPAARRRVDGLLQAPEAHTAMAQVGDCPDEVLEAASEPVELPDHERIAGPRVGQGFLQAGPLGLGPACLVGVRAAPRFLVHLKWESSARIYIRLYPYMRPDRVIFSPVPRRLRSGICHILEFNTL